MSNQNADSAALFSWRDHALCNSMGPDLFFGPPSRELKDQERTREAAAKTICDACVVRQECREYAIAHREPEGIWGGLDEKERRQIIKSHRGEQSKAS